eukprot:3866074-Pleurochrysis_carterae.AAC.2
MAHQDYAFAIKGQTRLHDALLRLLVLIPALWSQYKKLVTLARRVVPTAHSAGSLSQPCVARDAKLSANLATLWAQYRSSGHSCYPDSGVMARHCCGSPPRWAAVSLSSPRNPPRWPMRLRRLAPLRLSASIIGVWAVEIREGGSWLLHPSRSYACGPWPPESLPDEPPHSARPPLRDQCAVPISVSEHTSDERIGPISVSEHKSDERVEYDLQRECQLLPPPAALRAEPAAD